jgi:hypothetical protein
MKKLPSFPATADLHISIDEPIRSHTSIPLPMIRTIRLSEEVVRSDSIFRLAIVERTRRPACPGGDRERKQLAANTIQCTPKCPKAEEFDWVFSEPRFPPAAIR